MPAIINPPALLPEQPDGEWITLPELARICQVPYVQVFRWFSRNAVPGYQFFRSTLRIHASEMKTLYPVSTNNDDWMSMKEFARWTKIDPITIRRAVSHPVNPLPHIKVGGVIRIDVKLALAMARNKSRSRVGYKDHNVPVWGKLPHQPNEEPLPKKPKVPKGKEPFT